MDTPTGQPSTQTSKTVQWYQPTLTHLPTPTKDLFHEYVGLKTEDEIKKHINTIRDKAWQIHPYPCIGLFRFLTTSITLSPIYPQILSRLQSGQNLLDLGCCFGQDLRKLAFDAKITSTANLIGVDIEESFIHLGYELFRDRESFQGQFVTGSIFDETFLAERNGTIDMVYLGSFLHLFSFEKQRVIVARLGELLVPRGSVVFGRCIGAIQGGEFFMESLGWDMFRHSEETMRELWGVEWGVHCRLEGYEAAAVGLKEEPGDWQGGTTMQMTFWVTRTDG